MRFGCSQKFLTCLRIRKRRTSEPTLLVSIKLFRVEKYIFLTQLDLYKKYVFKKCSRLSAFKIELHRPANVLTKITVTVV